VIEGDDLELYFGSHCIGVVSSTYYSDINWYGTLRPSDAMPARVWDFIAMCQDWHIRLAAGEPHDADEFNAWRDIHDVGEWRTVGPDGSVKWIIAPVFWPDGDICWRAAKSVNRRG
jgi:hypothetical protein